MSRGAVFIGRVYGQPRWRAHWESSEGDGPGVEGNRVLENGGEFDSADAAVAWGRERTDRIVVDAGGDRFYWAGTAPAPADLTGPWPGEDALE
jgi:hypothetical protein